MSIDFQRTITAVEFEKIKYYMHVSTMVNLRLKILSEMGV